MNRSSKLFMAAVLLSAGYGLASLFGSPNLSYLSGVSDVKSAWPRSDTSISVPQPTSGTGNRPVGGVRLLPDLSTLEQVKPDPSTAAGSMERSPLNARNATVQPPLLRSNAPLSQASTPAAASAPAVNFAPPPLALEQPTSIAADDRSTLRARFSDTPPRPLLTHEPAQPLTMQPPPKPAPGFLTAASSSAKVGEEPISIPKRETAKTERAQPTVPGWGLPSAQPASVERVVPPPPLAAPPLSSPAPWQQPAPPQRTHIIVDGDSLQKLAKRYLSDPQKGDEIFAANRNVLNSPDLLPIGTELVIPAVKATGRGG